MNVASFAGASWLGAFLGSVIAGVIALAAGSRRARAVAYLVMAAGACVGASGSAAFLIADLPSLTLFASPWLFGAPLAADRLSAFFLLLLHIVTAMSAWFGVTYGEEERGKYAPRAVIPLLALFSVGMQGVLLSSGLASFLLFWEAMSLAGFFLVMVDGEASSRRAALLYLAVAQFGAGALLVGLGLLSCGQLTMTFAALGPVAATLSPTASTLATALVFFAFTSKAGLAPFHAWLPEAHPRAPSHASALMSGVMLKVAVYGLLRFTSICWPELSSVWTIGLLALGFGGAAIAAIYANFARELKQILAWSSVENIGLILGMFGFSLLLRSEGWPTLSASVQAAMFVHIAAHALFKSGLFLGAGAVIHATHTAKIEELGGLASRMPTLSAAWLVLVLAAAGLPPTGTFVAEWRLLQAAISSLATRNPAVTLSAAGILVGMSFVAGLAVFAMVRIFALTFLAEPRSEHARQALPPQPDLERPVLALAGAVLLLGAAAPWAGAFFPSPLVLSAWPLATASADGAGSPAAQSLVPVALAAAMVVVVFASWLVMRAVAGKPKIRRYHTWDCGQPIDATMEYTATAFSAPLRHFLRDIVRAEKHVVFRPAVSSNPWIRQGKMEFRKAEGVLERLYFPIASLIEGVGVWLRRLQNGVIQFYIALILATLLLTLWVAL